MTTTKPTLISASEMVQSLTGFEEIAVEKHMGIDPYADGTNKPIKVLRALVFVQQLRAGKDSAAARKAAMELSFTEVNDLFADEEIEVDPENPVTASGEDSAPSA